MVSNSLDFFINFLIGFFLGTIIRNDSITSLRELLLRQLALHDSINLLIRIPSGFTESLPANLLVRIDIPEFI